MSRLVIFHKQLGDTVLLEPVMRKHAAAAGGFVDLLCPGAFEPLVELMPHVRMASGRRRWLPDSVWAYDWGGRTTRAAAFTPCRDKHLLIPNQEWLKLSHRMAFGDLRVRPYLDRHMSRYFWDETAVQGEESSFSHARLEIPPGGWAADFWTGVPYLLLNPVSAWKRKSYDVQKWAKVLAHAHEMGLPQVMMSGGTEDWQRQHCAEIVAAARAKGVMINDISGRTSLKEFMHLVSRASLVLCVDGAAAHLARGFGVPCLTLFGPSYRALWHEEDTSHLALDASDFSPDRRPSAAMIPSEKVHDALQQLVTRVGSCAIPFFYHHVTAFHTSTWLV